MTGLRWRALNALEGGGTGSGNGTAPGGSGPPSRPPWAYVGLGFELVVPIVLGMLLGLWLDARWDTRPWLALLGVLLGIGAGFYNFFRVVLGTTKG